MAPFDEVIAGWRRDGERWVAELPTGWGQGRTVYGGLSAAMLVELVRRTVDRPVRVLQLQYLAPIVPGAVEGRIEVVRSGRSCTFVRVELVQDGVPGLVGHATLIAARPGTEVVPPAAPVWPEPTRIVPLQPVPGAIPEFVQHFDLRWVEGSIPFQGADEARFGAYVGFREPSAQRVQAHQIAMLDAFPCPTLGLLDRPVPASTVTWSAHLLAPPEPGPHRFRYRTVAAADGFSTAVGYLWGPSGALVAWTEQTVAVFG